MDIAALNQQAIDRSDAEDPALFQAVLDLMCERRDTSEKIHARLVETHPEVSLAAVRAIIGSVKFVTAYAEAQDDLEQYCRKRVKRNLPRMLRGIETLADDRNEDKRTRTSNLQWYAGVGGLSPTQKVEVGEDLRTVFEKIVGPSLKPRGDDAG